MLIFLFEFYFFSNTWDEHLFELVLPRPCTVGHIDVKFSLLNMCTTLPNIQVTLLKQNISNIGKQQQQQPPAVSTDSSIHTSNNTSNTGTSLLSSFGSLHISATANAEPQPSTSVEVDQKLDFNLHYKSDLLDDSSSSFNSRKQTEVNNVLDPLFLEMHNAEILCGPLSISSCLDLSGSSGLVSLTSPQLLNSKSRSFLLHIKGFSTKGEDSMERPQVLIL